MGRWTLFHPAVFFLTFTSYALYHLVRKTLSYVKSTIVKEWTPSTASVCSAGGCFPDDTWSRPNLFLDHESAEAFLGILNATFLFAYAVGLYLSGMVADRIDLRIFLTIGMCLSAVVIFIFGPVLEWSGSYSQPAYITLMVLNGLLQSTGWPCGVAVMGNWFGKSSRGLVLGLWSASPSLGSIVGALMVSTVVGYGYEYAFMLSSCSLFAGGLVVFFGLLVSPRVVGLPMPDEYDVDVERDTPALTATETPSESFPNCHQTRGLGHVNMGFNKKYSDMSSDIQEEGSLQSKSAPRTSSGSTRNVIDTHSQPGDRVGFHEDHTMTEKLSASTRRRRSNTIHATSQPGNRAAFHDDHTKINRTGRRHSDPMSLSHTAREAHIHRLVKESSYNFASDAIVNLHDEQGRDPNEKESGFRKVDNIAQPCGHNESTRLEEERCYKADAKYEQGSNQEETLTKRTNHGGIARSDRNVEASVPASLTAAVKLSSSAPNSNPNTRPKAISFLGALLLPGVIPYSLAFAFLKMVNYVFFFWLPFYLSSSYGWPESAADQLSIWYDVGGVVGGTVAGVLGNKFNKRGLVVTPMLVMAVPILYVYENLGVAHDMTVNAIMLVCIGGLIGGVANVIAAVITSDLGRQDAIRGNVEALATVSGIIEGTGTMGAALGQVAVPYLKASFGWGSVIYLLMVSIALAAVNILPIVVVEVKDMVKRK